jgi:TIR domain
MARGRIFINYRRDDSRADSGRLYDRLAVRFPGCVFRDVASLEPGVEWHDAIARVLGQADACIVVIGKDWLNITDASGRRRLDDPCDTVRLEIVTALERKMRVFPVLVGGAKMPNEAEVPPDLQSLCRRNALEITEQDWDEDFDKLLKAMETSLGFRPKNLEGGSSRKKWLWAAAGGVAAVIMIAAYNARDNSPSGKAPSSPASSQAGVRPDPGPPLASPAPAPKRANTQQAYVAPREPQPVEPTPTPEPPRRPALTAAHFVGNWVAAVNSNGQRLNQLVEVYGDNSFRVLTGNEVAGVGRWNYNPASETLNVTDGTNFLTNGLKFACTYRMVTTEEFNGDCRDRLQNSWTVLLTRGIGGPPEVTDDVPRIDISGLTMGEKAAFVQALATSRCTCSCGLSVLVCLRKDRTCNFSPDIARNALALFLRMTRG